MLKNESDIIKAIYDDEWMMSIIHVAAELNLPQWIIGAGFIRNFVWDIQHDRVPSHRNNDIDIIYYDKERDDWEFDQIYEKQLLAINPDVNWEVTNQAHIHTYNDKNNPPYLSATDGLAHWTETATCTGVTYYNNDLRIVAPWSIEDLLSIKLRIPPCHIGKPEYEKLFYDRIKKKDWLEKWPLLTIVHI